MNVARSIVVNVAAILVLAGPAIAQESGHFVVRLGRDTTAFESYTRTQSKVTIDQVGRAPRVLRRHFEFDWASGETPARVTALITAPGAPAGSPPIQQITAAFDGDSVKLEVRRDTTVTHSSLAIPKGTVAVSNGSPWAIYERETMKLAREKADSLRVPLYQLGAPRMNWLSIRKLGRDSVVVQTESDLFHAAVDAKGTILHVVPLAGTQKFTVDRVKSLDLEAMAAAFAAGEKQAGAMGALSPRDTVHASVAGATLTVDYGRPGKRGRTVFGGVVPYGELWRTGANAATQFRTDKSLVIGGVDVPAGFYTLWTIPSTNGWKLIVNSETGQWGTDHKADKDLYTIDMKTSALAQPVERFTISISPDDGAGVLNLEWDTTRATVPFTVKP